jgi:hypothetical protein
MSEVGRLGIARLFVDVKVSIEEMKDWAPDRIDSFFEGLAKVQAAGNPNNWDGEREVKGDDNDR